jgi:hypothetical protein
MGLAKLVNPVGAAVDLTRSRGDAERKNAEGKAPETAEKTICPKCGNDVMETGWTGRGEWTESWMRFRGRGSILIASTKMAAEYAECMCCRAQLALTPVELQRIA